MVNNSIQNPYFEMWLCTANVKVNLVGFYGNGQYGDRIMPLIHILYKYYAYVCDVKLN